MSRRASKRTTAYHLHKDGPRYIRLNKIKKKSKKNYCLLIFVFSSSYFIFVMSPISLWSSLLGPGPRPRTGSQHRFGGVEPIVRFHFVPARSTVRLQRAIRETNGGCLLSLMPHAPHAHRLCPHVVSVHRTSLLVRLVLFFTLYNFYFCYHALLLLFSCLPLKSYRFYYYYYLELQFCRHMGSG